MERMRAAAVVLMAMVTLAAPAAAQRAVVSPGSDHAVALRRWVAVTHTWDYLQQSHQEGEGAWLTLTSLFGINGSDRIADAAVYVFGGGQLFLNVFHHIQPGRENRLLPGDRYFGPGGNLGFDGQPPEYRGETIVVVSSESLIVTGAIIRGFSFANQSDVGLTWSHSQAARTLDVRQFDCSVPTDFARVAQFCRLAARDER